MWCRYDFPDGGRAVPLVKYPMRMGDRSAMMVRFKGTVGVLGSRDVSWGASRQSIIAVKSSTLLIHNNTHEGGGGGGASRGDTTRCKQFGFHHAHMEACHTDSWHGLGLQGSPRTSIRATRGSGTQPVRAGPDAPRTAQVHGIRPHRAGLTAAVTHHRPMGPATGRMASFPLRPLFRGTAVPLPTMRWGVGLRA